MTERALLAVGDDVAISAASTSYFSPLGMSAAPGVGAVTTEAAARTKHKGVDAAVDRLTVRCRTNARSSDSIFRLVKNGAASALAVTFAAGITGIVQDLTHSVGLTDGDSYSLEQVMGSGAGALNCPSIAARLSTEGQAFCQIAGIGSQNINVASTVRYISFPGLLQVASTTEATAQIGAPEAQTASNLQVYVASNARTNDTTVKSRKNGADGTQIVTIAAGLTGLFEDTTHTDNLAQGDLINTVITTLTGTQIITFSNIGMKLTGAVANRSPMFSRGSTTLSAGVTRLVSPWGRPTATSTESSVQCAAPYRGDWTDMGVNISANTSTTDVTVISRVNGANGNQTVTVGAGLTGIFRSLVGPDTLNSSDLIGISMSGATTGSLTVRGTSGLFTADTASEINQAVTVGIGLAASATSQAAHRASVAVGVGLSASGGVGRVLAVSVNVGLGLAVGLAAQLQARANVLSELALSASAQPAKALSVAVEVGLGLAAVALMAGRRAILGAVDVLSGSRLKLIGAGETKEFSNDWATWLAGGVISSSTWAISPEGPELTSMFHSSAETTCLVSGAEVGAIYRLTNVVTTESGLTAEKSFTLRGAPL